MRGPFFLTKTVKIYYTKGINNIGNVEVRKYRCTCVDKIKEYLD